MKSRGDGSTRSTGLRPYSLRVDLRNVFARCALSAGAFDNGSLGESDMRLLILIILIVLVVGALPSWPYSSGWGYYPSSGLGTLLIIIIVLALLGVI